MSKYDYLSLKCFGREYRHLTADDQITIVDLYNERNE